MNNIKTKKYFFTLCISYERGFFNKKIHSSMDGIATIEKGVTKQEVYNYLLKDLLEKNNLIYEDQNFSILHFYLEENRL